MPFHFERRERWGDHCSESEALSRSALSLLVESHTLREHFTSDWEPLEPMPRQLDMGNKCCRCPDLLAPSPVQIYVIFMVYSLYTVAQDKTAAEELAWPQHSRVGASWCLCDDKTASTIWKMTSGGLNQYICPAKLHYLGGSIGIHGMYYLIGFCWC